MSQWRDMLQIYGLFIASIITLVGAIIIGAGLSSGSAGVAAVLLLIGGIMAFIGLGIIWKALKKPRPRSQWQYSYYQQYPGYQPYYPYQQYQQYPAYYQQPQYPQPTQQSRPYPATYPTPRYPSYYPPQRSYPPPPQQPYRQPTQPPPPPPPDYREKHEPIKEERETYRPVESYEPHEDEEFPPPPDYSQITRDPYYKPEEEHVPVVKEQPVTPAPRPQAHKVRQPVSYSQQQPAYGQQQYPSGYGRPQQAYSYQSYPYRQYPYPQPYPSYGEPPGEAKLELPSMLTLFVIFIGAIFIGALGLYTGGILILFFPIAFIIAFSFPSFMWISYVYRKDVHEPEPRRVVMIALTFGFLSTILALALSAPLAFLFPSLAFSAVVVAPVVEEFCKASGLRLVRGEINAQIDGVIYGVTIGMGFAMVENFLYELGFIFSDPAVWTFGSLLRGLGSTIGHGLGAGFIGYAYASYHMNRDQPGAFGNVIKAYIAAVGLHALWNGVAFISGENALGLVVIILIAVAEVVILKTLVSIARDKDIQRMTEDLAHEPAP